VFHARNVQEKSLMANLLNRSAAKKVVLKKFKSLRSGPPMTRVSSSYLDELELAILAKIESDVQRHRSVGKTFRP